MSWAIVLPGIVYLVSWAICLLMLYVVPRRREPEASVGWLLFSFILPYLAILLFFLIGSPKLPRARRERQHAMDQTLAKMREALEADPQLAHIFSHTLEPRRQQVAALVERLGGMSVTHGDIELLSDYAATIERIAADIDTAQHYVHLLYYIFADDECGRMVVDALCRAEVRGVVC